MENASKSLGSCVENFEEIYFKEILTLNAFIFITFSTMSDSKLQDGPEKRPRPDDLWSQDAEHGASPAAKRGRAAKTDVEAAVLSDVEDGDLDATPPVSRLSRVCTSDSTRTDAECLTLAASYRRAIAELIAAHHDAPAAHLHPPNWVPKSFPLSGLRGDGTGVFFWPPEMVHRWPLASAPVLTSLPASDGSAPICGAVPPPNTWFVCRADGTWAASPADVLRAPAPGSDYFAAFAASASSSGPSGGSAASVEALGADGFLELLRQPLWRAPLPATPLFAGAAAGAPLPAVLHGSTSFAAAGGSSSAAGGAGSVSAVGAVLEHEHEHERGRALAGATAAASIAASTAASAAPALAGSSGPAPRSVVGTGVPGNGLHAEAARLQRVSAFARMTPASFGQAMLCATQGWHPCPPITHAAAATGGAASASSASGGPSACAGASADGAAATSASASPTRRVKLLALDVDGTVIVPSDPKKDFCQTDSDWKFAFPAVKERIRAFHASGYAIAFLSNQKGISTARTTAATVQRRFERVALALGVPVLMMAAPAAGLFRKPSPGLLWLAQALCFGGLQLDRAASLYVGDAAGRRVSI